MDSESSLNMLPFGLIELDATTGTVLYYKPEQAENFDASPSEIVGLNFFTEVAPIAQASEFQNRIRNFGRSHAPAMSFNFTFVYGHRTLPVRVLLARIHEHSGLDKTESLFVHIRSGQHQIAA
jgi:photoactive yellow protein